MPIIGFSLIINSLYLTGPLFMMQVYDRVLASANIPTLIALLLIVLILYAFFGTLEYIRTQVLVSHGEAATESLAQKAYHICMLERTIPEPNKEKLNALEEVSTLRAFLISPTFSALFDLPWSPIFLFFVFSLHPGLGSIALIATFILTILAIINERLSRKTIESASASTQAAHQSALTAQRNATTLLANGMLQSFGKTWQQADHTARRKSIDASTINSSFSTLTKTLRLAIQSIMLGAGAYFVIQGEMSPGGIIAGSITFARALAPLEQLLGNFSQLVNARSSWKHIKQWQQAKIDDTDKETLPPPKKTLEVSKLTIIAPHTKTAILKNINFSLSAGDILGISGPSGCGKSTLAKALTNTLPANLGKVCLDGAELNQWPRETLGAYIGYLPQEIELFDGTIAQNIARFNEQDNFNAILKASQMADTHKLILSLPEGYNTRLGIQGMALSAGQRQRIALARALYGDPFLIILDEPNSNLDRAGDEAITHTLQTLKQNKCITVMIVHRPNTLTLANKLLIMAEGEVKAFGPPESIMQAAKAKKTMPVALT